MRNRDKGHEDTKAQRVVNMATNKELQDNIAAITWLDKPFALFAGAKFYSSPGWHDYCGQHATLSDASTVGKAKLTSSSDDWWQVVDLRTLEIVAGEGSGHTGLFGEIPADPSLSAEG